jgi:hypothetical protein
MGTIDPSGSSRTQPGDRTSQVLPFHQPTRLKFGGAGDEARTRDPYLGKEGGRFRSVLNTGFPPIPSFHPHLKICDPHETWVRCDYGAG